jgi:hypothetical protein
VTVTKQIPAGTATDAGPDVLDENNVVDAAAAGPEPATNPTTPTSAVAAAPTPATAPRSATRTPSASVPAGRIRTSGRYHRSVEASWIAPGRATAYPEHPTGDAHPETSTLDQAPTRPARPGPCSAPRCPNPGRCTDQRNAGLATSEPLCERCARHSSPERVTVQREAAGHDVESREGDSNS